MTKKNTTPDALENQDIGKDIIITDAFVGDEVQRRIYTIRGVQVMLDSDLAFFYGVETKRINEAVKRNPNRFPKDFMFQLSQEETDASRSQNVTLVTSSEPDCYDDFSRSRSQNATLNKQRGHNIADIKNRFCMT